MHNITLHYITVHCKTLQNITLHNITLHYITLHNITLHKITLHAIAQHCITLALHYVTLRCITLHYIALKFDTNIEYIPPLYTFMCINIPISRPYNITCHTLSLYLLYNLLAGIFSPSLPLPGSHQLQHCQQTKAVSLVTCAPNSKSL